LTRLTGEDVISKLMGHLSRENTARMKNACMRSLIEVLGKRPEGIEELFNDRTRSRVPIVYRRLFKRLPVSPEGFSVIIKHMMRIIRESFEETSGGKKGHASGSRLMVLLKILALKNITLFLKYLRTEKITDDERFIILRVLNSARIYDYAALSVDFMAEQFKSALPGTKMQYLNFFRRMPLPGKRIEQLIIDGLCDEKDDIVEKEIEKIIARRL